METKIIEKIVEPSKVYVGSTFKLKIKVYDEYFRRNIVAENGLIILTENGKTIRTEWGD